MSLSPSVNNRVSPKSIKKLPVDRAKSESKISSTSLDQPKSKRSNKPIVCGKTRHPYDTLDSAYSTSESSYNTVDSTYSQQSSTSGYDTLELKCNSSNPPVDRRWHDSESSRLKPPSAPSFGVGVTGGKTVTDDIRFVDDIDESDTATETETDTEPAASSNCIDMSYVPDYIRPVSILPPSSAPHLNNQSSSVNACLSSSSSTSTLTATSSKDDNSEMQRLNYRRPERNSQHTAYREDYLRKQKEKLCGRKSLDDRLRSLESGAAVKLQVCKGSQNRRRKSIDREAIFSKRTLNNDVLIPHAKSQNLTADIKIEDSDKQDHQIEATPTRAPPPDIIESHQPPTHMVARTVRKNTLRDEEFSLSNKTNGHVEVLDLSSKKVEEKNFPTSKETVVESLEQTPLSPVLVRKNSFSKVESPIDSHIPQPTSSRSQISDAIDQPPASDVKVTKLKWREPSQEALNKLHASQLATTRSQVQPPTIPSEKENKPSENTEKSKLADRVLTPLVVDVTTEHRVVPVELRSPRHDGETRSNMKGKRNARVFVFPSDENESDLKQHEDDSRLDLATPVKFVPSVLRRSGGKSSQEEVISTSNSSLVTNPKAASANDTQSDLTNKQVTSSQSLVPAKRPSTKRSKSSHDRSAVDKTRVSRTLSSGDQSPTIHSARSSDRYKDRSPERDSRSRSDRKAHRTPSRGRKSKTEYTELSDVKRCSHHSKKLATSNLPSPRQQAVAHAVKFGVSGNEGEFPFIDDTTATAEERSKPLPADPRDRSKSDGALLHDADTATVRRAFPLSRRGRSSKRKDGPRRISYMEAMESSEDLTPDPESDATNYGGLKTASGKDDSVPLGTYGRSNSADSVLSTTEIPTKVVLRKHTRANSADRGSLKKSHRRSYQIATNKPVDAVANRYSPHKRQPSIRRLKSFFENNQQTPETQATEGRRRSRGRSLDPLPTLVLSECDGNIVREGFLSFKVATIEKGKRASSQKSWKLVWVVLKDQSLFLCKDWSRNKAETPQHENGPPIHLTPPSGGHTPPSPPTQLVLEEEEPLNIQGSLISIAYNYVKRKNVIRLTTCNGSEYLFQAEDRDDMLAWISSIQTRSCHDDEGGEGAINKDLILKKSSQIEAGFLSASRRSPIFARKIKLSPKPEKRANRKSRSPKPSRRQGVPIKDVDGSRRFKWRGSVNRIVKKFGQGQTLMPGGTFDVHLEDCPPSASNEMVPFVVDLCCRIVEEHGLNFTGIYRVPGNSGTLSALQEELNLRGAEAVDLDNDTRFGELNVVSSLLKSFFRKLPDPLFTNELYEDFIAMNRRKDSEERLNGLRRLIHMLPAPHYETLKYLITHLRKVADHSEVNKMEIRNLAIVFGPTLVRSTISDCMATMVTDMSDQCRIVESVLQHAAWFFSGDEVQGPGVQNRPVPKDEDHEPVPNIDHLLANVGRTPGDNSDTTSESSKSKISNNSEKESLSRDVLEIIFGAGKRLLHHSQRPGKEEGLEEDSGDEYGFKEAEKKLPRVSTEPPKSPTKPSYSAPQKYQVAKPVASDIRANWRNKNRLMPPDITSSLYDYYLDNLDRTPRTDVTRYPQYATSSSAESSPHVTPRGSSLFIPPVQRTYAMQARHSEGAKPYTMKGQRPPHLNYQHQVSQESTPRMYASREEIRESTSARDVSNDKNPPEDVNCEENSDSDSSIYVGETLEEKLKNLTNLEKKLERRPSRRHANRRDVMKMMPPSDQFSSKAANKKLTAPSQLAGERITPDNLHMYSGKKTTREMYRERKAQRQHQRELVRARRNETSSEGINRCISDENVFKRSDPKRQVLRSNANDDASRLKRSSSGEKVRRRHTLGGGDFPGQDFWQHTQYASLQNVSQDDPLSAVARLRPHGASGPLLRNLSNAKMYQPAAVASKRPEKHKTESYL